MDAMDGGKEETIITRKPETTIDCAVNCDVDDGSGGMDGWLAGWLNNLTQYTLIVSLHLSLFPQFSTRPCRAMGQTSEMMMTMLTRERRMNWTGSVWSGVADGGGAEEEEEEAVIVIAPMPNKTTKVQ